MEKHIFWITSEFRVQLDNWHYNANNGTVNNKIYFVAKQKAENEPTSIGRGNEHNICEAKKKDVEDKIYFEPIAMFALKIKVKTTKPFQNINTNANIKKCTE
ncbi:hypothetical protein RFI_04585 [Reticulomyxa filosa]|uniref:Uncharacterized protein n=1 Tax=Reticulomyxa filosa TaxID=46433 RepID=X6P1W0_RETFI|nr:hypothetical protein RFI_04585 [Reticulomyxa filosa]|eukprot:ETO32530.1 hypothetical protein RFI_04585 [Reticulomyxa filosa]